MDAGAGVDEPGGGFGAWRPVIVVQRPLLDTPDTLRIVLAHELMHVRRGDFFWALLDCLTCAVFAFHPLAWVLRRDVERCRETSCDAEVMAVGLVRRGEYAELLAHAHTPAQFPIPAVAASLSPRAITLKERLETMEDFADTRLTFRRRAGLVFGAGALFLLVAAGAACAGKPAVLPAAQVTADVPALFDAAELAEFMGTRAERAARAPYSPPGWPLQRGELVSGERMNELSREFPSVCGIRAPFWVGDMVFGAVWHGDGEAWDGGEAARPPGLGAPSLQRPHPAVQLRAFVPPHLTAAAPSGPRPRNSEPSPGHDRLGPGGRRDDGDMDAGAVAGRIHGKRPVNGAGHAAAAATLAFMAPVPATALGLGLSGATPASW